MTDDDSVQRIVIRIQEGLLQCLKDGREVWRIPIHALLLIAEYTTNEGPRDDYFLNLWTFENSKFIKYSISFYADGRDATFEALAQRLGAELQFGLTSSTEWASRVMWPPELAGHPYYTFCKVEPKTWLQKLRDFCLGQAEECFIAKEVQEYLKCHEDPRPSS